MKMKSTITVILLAFVALSIGYLALRGTGSGGGQTQPETASAPAGTSPAVAATNTADDTPAPAHQVLAYYLHNSTRCPSCIKIEKFTTAVINAGFADELESGKLVFQVLNTDEKGNEHFTKDYELVTKSVILADMHNGEQTRWVNLEEVWDLLGDEKKFAKYIQKNVRDYLNEKK